MVELNEKFDEGEKGRATSDVEAGPATPATGAPATSAAQEQSQPAVQPVAAESARAFKAGDKVTIKGAGSGYREGVVTKVAKPDEHGRAFVTVETNKGEARFQDRLLSLA